MAIASSCDATRCRVELPSFSAFVARRFEHGASIMGGAEWRIGEG
jgi:hypothetical protein